MAPTIAPVRTAPPAVAGRRIQAPKPRDDRENDKESPPVKAAMCHRERGNQQQR